MTTHPAEDELAACVALLKSIDGAGRAARAHAQRAGVAVTQNELATRLPEVSDVERDTVLDPSLPCTDLQPLGWIYGKRAYGPDVPLVPAITVRWDTTRPDPYLQILVVLAVAGATSADSRGLSATAYRFEMRVGGTVHDYDHVQPSLSLSPGGESLPGVLGPLSTTTPGFPLDSNGYVGLTMCVIRSLYGSKGLLTMLSEDPAIRTAVQPFLGQMPAFASRSAVPAVAETQTGRG